MVKFILWLEFSVASFDKTIKLYLFLIIKFKSIHTLLETNKNSANIFFVFLGHNLSDMSENMLFRLKNH